MADATLSATEATQYDRQIRLWGVDAQRRLGAAKVLVIGATGLGAELCKNLVLAGIAALTLQDGGAVCEADLTGQFFLSLAHLGTPRAEASLPGLCLLNPNVHVVANLAPVAANTPEYYAQFDLVCMTIGSARDMAAANDACRMHGVKFACGRVFGMYGFVFADFLSHSFDEETKVESGPAEKTHEAVTVYKTCTEEFVPLQVALSASYASLRIRRASPVFFSLLTLNMFAALNGREPAASLDSDDEKLIEAKNKALEAAGLSSSSVSDETAKELRAHMACEFAPVSAVLGGIFTGEAIKAISRKDRPQNNCFFFEGLSSLGLIQKLP